jgi:hypothetical protein
MAEDPDTLPSADINDTGSNGNNRPKRGPREIDSLTARVEGLDIQIRGLLHALQAITLMLLALMIVVTILWLRSRGTSPLTAVP